MEQSFDKALKILRKYNHMTQPTLAKLLNRSLPTIKKYEAGEIIMPIDVLSDVCSIFHINLDDMWFLSKINISGSLRDSIESSFNEINCKTTLSSNDYLLVNTSVGTSEPLTIVAEASKLQEIINLTYYQYIPVSFLLYKRIVYLAVCLYWQQTIYPQIKKALNQAPSLLKEFEKHYNLISEKISKEQEALIIFKCIITNANNGNELQHLLPLLRQLNEGLAKIE